MEEGNACGFDYLVHINFENKKQTNKILFNSFPFVLIYGQTMHHSPVMNRNIWGIRLILRPCLEHRVLCVCSHWKFDHKYDLASSTGRYTGSQNSQLCAYKFTEFVQQQHMQAQRNVPLIRKSADTVLHLLARATRSNIPIFNVNLKSPIC
jgi:hypothetical protein